MDSASQMVFDMVVGVVGVLVMFIMNSMRSALKDLQETDKALSEHIVKLEVLVAGDYVRKEEFNQLCTTLFAKLDKISDKIDQKADK